MSSQSFRRSAAPVHQLRPDSLALRVFVARSADTALSKDILWKSPVTIGAPSGTVVLCAPK